MGLTSSWASTPSLGWGRIRMLVQQCWTLVTLVLSIGGVHNKRGLSSYLNNVPSCFLHKAKKLKTKTYMILHNELMTSDMFKFSWFLPTSGFLVSTQARILYSRLLKAATSPTILNLRSGTYQQGNQDITVQLCEVNTKLCRSCRKKAGNFMIIQKDSNMQELKSEMVSSKYLLMAECRLWTDIPASGPNSWGSMGCCLPAKWPSVCKDAI